MDYKSAGVDIEAGAALVELIKPIAAGTRRAGVMGQIGGFGALFDLKAAGFHDPILVSTSDGVGTKLKIAIECNQHKTIGIDLVAMCVNDLLAQGAMPLFFLDYYASGRLDLDIARDIIRGIAHGCVQAGCALVGGETAEMPGLYHGADYDLAGFAVGAVERGLVLPRTMEADDVIIGIASNGLHSNGYSLLRRVMQDTQTSWDGSAEFARGRSFADVFLTPTRIYTAPIKALHSAGLLRGLAHITGGGLAGNLSRILPIGLKAVIDQPWPVPPMFHWIAKQGAISATEMLRTFNCGLGMVAIVRACDVAETMLILKGLGESACAIGRLATTIEVEIQVSIFE